MRRLLGPIIAAAISLALVGGVTAAITVARSDAPTQTVEVAKKPHKTVKKKKKKRPKLKRCARAAASASGGALTVRRRPKKRAKKPRKRRPVPCTVVPAPSTPPPAVPAVPGPNPVIPPAPPVQDLVLGDDDNAASLYSVGAATPGVPVARCIRVRLESGPDAEVRLSLTGTPGALAAFVEISVEAGTLPGASPDCAGFAAVGAPIVRDTLAGLLAARRDWDSGIPVPGPAAMRWSAGQGVAFRVTVMLRDDPAANGAAAGPLTTGPHSYVWEARSG